MKITAFAFEYSCVVLPHLVLPDRIAFPVPIFCRFKNPHILVISILGPLCTESPKIDYIFSSFFFLIKGGKQEWSRFLCWYGHYDNITIVLAYQRYFSIDDEINVGMQNAFLLKLLYQMWAMIL